MPDRWATFDCYGTLIDWFGGIRNALARLWPDEPLDDLMATYHRLAYDDTYARGGGDEQNLLIPLGAEHGLSVPPGRESTLSDSVRDWPAFPEVPASLREVQASGWKMAILTNVDAEGLITSLPKLGVAFDAYVTPHQAGSYKPAAGHWETFFRQTGGSPDRHVHVAASWFHDLRYTSPAGMRCVWINRRGENPDYNRTAELPTLDGLADALDRIQPR